MSTQNPINTYNAGEKLVCINTKPLPGNTVAPDLKEGDLYWIKSICLDSAGNQHLDVGIKSTVAFVRSYETKEQLPDGDKIHWCHPSRFRLAVPNHVE